MISTSRRSLTRWRKPEVWPWAIPAMATRSGAVDPADDCVWLREMGVSSKTMANVKRVSSERRIGASWKTPDADARVEGLFGVLVLWGCVGERRGFRSRVFWGLGVVVGGSVVLAG